MHWLTANYNWIYPAAAYLVGSILAAPVFAYFYGINIRGTDSGNPGFANMLRSVGLSRALPVLVWDVGKGTTVVFAAQQYGGTTAASWAALAVCAGHCFPIWNPLRGGKGVATFFGALLPLAPVSVLVGAVSWILLAKTVKISALASLAGVVATLVVLSTQNQNQILVSALLMAVMILLRHRDNLKRLGQGSENRLTHQDADTAPGRNHGR